MDFVTFCQSCSSFGKMMTLDSFMDRMIRAYEQAIDREHLNVPRVRVFNRWVQQLLLIRTSNPKKYLFCCLLMVMIRQAIYNSRLFRVLLKGTLHTVYDNMDHETEDFFRLMKLVYRLLDHDTIREILELPSDESGSFLRKIFPIKTVTIFLFIFMLTGESLMLT